MYAAGMIMVLFRFLRIPQAFTYLNTWWHYKGLHHMPFSGGPQHMKTKGNWATSSSRYPNGWWHNCNQNTNYITCM